MNIDHYVSTRIQFLQQVESGKVFAVAVVVLAAAALLTYMTILSHEMLIVLTVLLASKMIACIGDWIWPITQFQARMAQSRFTHHVYAIITVNAGFVSQFLWPHKKDASPIKIKKRSHDIAGSIENLRQMIADILLSSPYNHQDLLINVDDTKANTSYSIDHLLAGPNHNIINNTPWLLMPIRWILEFFINLVDKDNKPNPVTSDQIMKHTHHQTKLEYPNAQAQPTCDQHQDRQYRV